MHKPIVVFQNCVSSWWTQIQQNEKHVWAKNLYFWSKIVPNNSLIPSYANTPISTIQSIMKLKKTYTQNNTKVVNGKTEVNPTANPTDDTYK